METQVKKWGNSLGIRLPQSITKQANIFDGTKVELIFKKNRIEIVPIKHPEYDLDGLLSGISEENRHDEISTGEAVGGELW